MKNFIFLVFVACLHAVSAFAEHSILRENFRNAKPGDYIVAAVNKNYTLLHIYAREGDVFTIEEISIPSNKVPSKFAWKEWLKNDAPGNASWVLYNLNIGTGQVLDSYSYFQDGWHLVPQNDNFIGTLLNLQLTKIPYHERKRTGVVPGGSMRDQQTVWNPRMTVEGQTIAGVAFDAWKTRWPRDNSELAGRVIEVYTPAENQRYPSYFPYWLQINGAIGKAKVRIIDSGYELVSPKTFPKL